MKKIAFTLLSVFLMFFFLFGCTSSPALPPEEDTPGLPQTPTEPTIISSLSSELKQNLSAEGYVQNNIDDFSLYENTSYYRKVSTADELITAIADAKYHYQNVWDDTTKTYTQIPAEGYTEETMLGKVRVIEITSDLNLGYYQLSEAVKKSGIVVDYGSKIPSLQAYLTMSDMVLENGISQIKIENTSNLLIYSKNGAKLTHCGFKLTSDTNVVFRNLSFDEIWQWEDSSVNTASNIGDYDWFGWAYFKISFCGYIWIDHCRFGKSYDGQIDYSNPVYNANAGTAFRAPYGADGSNGLHISWCEFLAGSADENGYLFQMMNQIEQEYQQGKTNYLYYNKLRDSGASFEDILYGLAIPQKKGFLCGDDATFSGSYDTADDYNFNLKLQVSFANCIFKNLEDRLPKLRGGNAYMYNCVVDCLEYSNSRAKLKAISAASRVAEINSKWKCALVSQGIVCGNGGSVKAESCIYRGIETLLKNNDSKNSSPYVNGGYQLVNCSYQKNEASPVYIGSSSDSGNSFTNSTPSLLKTADFNWHTANQQSPFTVSAFALEELEEVLNNATYGAGTNSSLQQEFLKSDYTK